MQISHSRPAEVSLKLKKQQRIIAIDAGFDYEVDGVIHSFQTEPAARSNVTGRAAKRTAKRSLGQPVPDFQWRNTANVMVNFTGEQFLEFAIAMDEFVEQQYQNSWN